MVMQVMVVSLFMSNMPQHLWEKEDFLSIHWHTVRQCFFCIALNGKYFSNNFTQCIIANQLRISIYNKSYSLLFTQEGKFNSNANDGFQVFFISIIVASKFHKRLKVFGFWFYYNDFNTTHQTRVKSQNKGLGSWSSPISCLYCWLNTSACSVD